MDASVICFLMRTVVVGAVIYCLTRLFLEAGGIVRMVVHGLVSASWELWVSIRLFLAIIRDAVREIWRHLTRENIHFLVALGIITYAIPEITRQVGRSRGEE